MSQLKFDVENDEHESVLRQILPLNYEGIVVTTEVLPDEGFSRIIRLALSTKTEALDWFENLQEISRITYKVARTHEENTQRTIFQKQYRCLHNTRPARTATPYEKHLNCNAKLTIYVRNCQMKGSKDPYLPKYLYEILLRHNHNHQFYTAVVFRYRNPAEKLKHEFKALFDRGHLPATASSVFKDVLLEEHGDKYHEVVADGQKCPTQKWVYDLYYGIFKKAYGEPSGLAMIESQEKCNQEYNKKCGNSCAAMNIEGTFATAICSPIMERVHQYVKAFEEIMFVDASGNMDSRVEQTKKYF